MAPRIPLSGTATESGAPTIPVPDKLFGRRPADYDIPILKRILAIFRKRLVKDQERNVLLQRLTYLHQELSPLQQHAVTQILARDLPVTRDLIAKWPDMQKESSDEVMLERDEEYKCDACEDTLPAGFFRRNKISPECDHGCTLCESCLTMGIDTALKDEETKWDAVPCPCCKVVVPPEVIRRYASAELLSEYDEYRVSFHLQGVKNFCLCARPGCRSGQFHEPGPKAPCMTCKKCGFQTCMKHRVPWNQGEDVYDHNATSCRQYSATERGEEWKGHWQHVESIRAIRALTRACPRCGVPIEKNGGCFSMYCTQCKTYFVWSNAKQFWGHTAASVVPESGGHSMRIG